MQKKTNYLLHYYLFLLYVVYTITCLSNHNTGPGVCGHEYVNDSLLCLHSHQHHC